MKYKIGDIVVIKSFRKSHYDKIGLNNISLGNTRTLILNHKGEVGIIKEIVGEGYYPILLSIKIIDSIWAESELRSATKKEIEKYEQELVENEI